MIRRQHGQEFVLITQDEHAKLSGRLAEHFGNLRFAYPTPRQPVINAVTLHDCGWALHDQEPTLNDGGLPLDVFETPIAITARVWTESARRALEADPYTGLLVSLHVFHLSAHSHKDYNDAAERRRHAKELFELNKFQQTQIEIQEKLRRQMKLLTEIPLELGLAPRGSSEAEDLLRYNYALLRAMDVVSLAALCGNKPFSVIDDFSPRPGFEPIEIRVGYPADWTITLTPWPFATDQIVIETPCKRVPARRFAQEKEFRDLYAKAPLETQTVRIARAS